MNNDDLLVLYDFHGLYQNARADKISIRTATETSYPFEKCMNDAVCGFFNSGRREESKRFAFLTVKHHNPKNLIFQHILINEN